MGKLTFLGVTAVFWLFMNYLLYKKEIAPFLEYEKPPSYESILKDKRRGEISKWGLLLGQTKLGELVTTITPNLSGYQIYTNVNFKINSALSDSFLFGRITSIMETNVDNNFRLVDSDIKTDMKTFNGGPDIKMELKCKRRGDKLYCEYVTPIGVGSDTIDFPKEATLANDFIPIYGTDQLKVGKKWEIQMTNFDFFSGSVKLTSLYASVESKESRVWEKRSIDTYKIYIKKAPTKRLPIYTIWVTEKGEVIEQEFDFKNIDLVDAKGVHKTTYRLVLEEKKKL